MSFLKSVVEGRNLAQEIKPTLRFGCWQKMGAGTRPADTRTTEQLLTNIEYFAQNNPEVAKIKKDLKTMNPKFLGLVSDICELANRHEMLSQNINMKALKTNNGQSLFSFILEKLPRASKENPKALEFTQEIINQTDTTASKYFLADFGGIMDVKEASKHLEATKPLIKTIAGNTLSGGLKMDFEKEKNFMNIIKILVHPDAKTEKISMIPKIEDAVSVLPDSAQMYIDRFVRSSAPIPQIEANIPQLKMACQEAQKRGEIFDINKFLTTNVNYAKPQPKLDMEAIKAGKFTLG